jgi:hypothetical protein
MRMASLDWMPPVASSIERFTTLPASRSPDSQTSRPECPAPGPSPGSS